MRIPNVVRMIIGGIVVLMLGGLAGWYFYLHAQEQTTSTNSALMGLSAPAPSFAGTTGSTQTNQALATGVVGYRSSATSSAELWEVDATPVAGMGFVTTETDEYLYYAERGNGYIFQAHPSTETTTRLTNTLMPKIYEALFAEDGSVIERSIDTNGNVTTFLGTIATSTAASTTVAIAPVGTTSASIAPAMLTGVYLQPGIQSIALNPATKALFYLVADPHGGEDGITQAWNGVKQKQVFSSLVGSWRPYFLQDGTMILLESPADGIPGYAYAVNASGALTPFLRDVPGLTILPKSGSNPLLYGSSQGSNLSLFAFATSSAQSLSLATVADKCVWLPGASQIAYCAVPNQATPDDFLDNWYEGTANTSDDWWEIDLSQGTVERIYSPSVDNVSLDVEDPTIDASGNYIAFKNASDQSLWVLRVAQ